MEKSEEDYKREIEALKSEVARLSTELKNKQLMINSLRRRDWSHKQHIGGS